MDILNFHGEEIEMWKRKEKILVQTLERKKLSFSWRLSSIEKERGPGQALFPQRPKRHVAPQLSGAGKLPAGIKPSTNTIDLINLALIRKSS